MLLAQKTAVIYGAAGAIGGAVSRAFAREGARVFLAGHTRAPLSALAQEISQAGGVAEAAEVDAPSIEEHLGAVVEKTGGIDIAFNAISISYTQGTPLVNVALETFSLGLAEAMQTQFLTSTAAARHMQKRGAGVLLTITATPARELIPNSGNFGVACAAIERLCQQLACELGPQGIRVICLRSAGSPDAPGVQWAMRVLAERAGYRRRRSRPVKRRKRCSSGCRSFPKWRRWPS